MAGAGLLSPDLAVHLGLVQMVQEAGVTDTSSTEIQVGESRLGQQIKGVSEGHFALKLIISNKNKYYLLLYSLNK